MSVEPQTFKLGGHWSYNILNDPKRLAFVLSRYRFVAGIAGRGKRILELGCSEGLGGRLLAEDAESYCGIDLDAEAVESTRANAWPSHVRFEVGDFLGRDLGTHDVVFSIDVVEHIERDIEHLFFETCTRNLADDGICIVGTPNLTSAAYASAASQLGHVNMFDGKRLTETLQRYFHNVFLFGLNDEVMHAGYANMSHFLMAVACYKKTASG
jgi:2-polyprenyl-3-methyl-5-hydroxy-6-metoxy-1,4-benzoquinol methylase